MVIKGIVAIKGIIGIEGRAGSRDVVAIVCKYVKVS